MVNLSKNFDTFIDFFDIICNILYRSLYQVDVVIPIKGLSNISYKILHFPKFIIIPCRGIGDLLA